MGDVIVIHVHKELPMETAEQIATEIRARVQPHGVDVVVVAGAVESVHVAQGSLPSELVQEEAIPAGLASRCIVHGNPLPCTICGRPLVDTEAPGG